MATVVGFISEKGGVGKTTACYHIAVALTRYHQRRVLVADADYQRGGITGRFFPELVESFDSGSIPGTTLYHKFQQLYGAVPLTPEVEIRTTSDNIDVLVADPRLATVTTDKLPSTNNIKQNSEALLSHLRRIDDVLKSLDTTYDYVLIDSHPEVSDVLRSIIYASQFCVSPVKLDRQSSIGVATIIGEINNVNSDVEMMTKMLDQSFRDGDTMYAGAMGMMAREYGGGLKYSESIEFNRLRRTGGIFDAYVTEGDGLRLAAAERAPVYDVGGANAEKQSAQFRRLTEEFLARCPA